MARGITDGIYAVSLSVSTAINIHDELLFWPTSVSVGTVPLRTSVGALASSILPQTVRVTDFGSIGTTNDTTVVQAALDGVAEKGTVIFSAGTYTIDLISVSKSMTIIVEKGATLKYKANATSATSMIDIVADDVTFYIKGIIDGNGTNQTGTTLRCIHSFGYDRIVIDGHHRSGIVQNISSGTNGIWLRDGDDLRVKDMRCSNLGGTPFYIESVNVDMYRPVLEGIFADLSSQGAITYQILSIHTTGNSRKIYDPVVMDCWVKCSPLSTNVPVELWAGTATPGEIVGGRVINNYVEGGALAISFDHCTQGLAYGNRVYNFSQAGIEFAASTKGRIFANQVNGNGNASTTGISVDNQNQGGTGTQVNGNYVQGCAQGISLKGSGSLYPTKSIVSDNVIEALVSDAYGIAGDLTPYLMISDNFVEVSGTLSRGISVFTTAEGHNVTGNKVNVRLGVAIGLTDSIRFNVFGNNVFGTSADVAYDIEQCNFGSATGGVISGLFANGAQITVNVSTMDYLTFGGWIGPGDSGGGLNFVVNGGSFGNNITCMPINGWHPFSAIANPSFNKMTGAFTTWVYADGVITGDPNSVISASPGSRLTDVSNGTTWVKVSGTSNTGWKVPQATSVNTP